MDERHFTAPQPSLPRQRNRRRWLRGTVALVAAALLLDYWAVKGEFSIEPLFRPQTGLMASLAAAPACAVLAIVVWWWQRWKPQVPYQVSIGGMLVITALASAALGFGRLAFLFFHNHTLASTAAVAAAVGLAGSIAGAVIGNGFTGPRGRLAVRGAVVGALVFLVPAFLYLALEFASEAMFSGMWDPA